MVKTKFIFLFQIPLPKTRRAESDDGSVDFMDMEQPMDNSGTNETVVSV
jgi:hypothetical protein